jgi:hypothetical protein
MQTIVDLSFDPSDRPFALPASGTQSLLFRFGDDTFGGVLTSATNEDFKPGSQHNGAALALWNADAAPVAIGVTFVVWYDGDVGRGVVTSISGSA